jgi:mannose-6-phosphate isomerase-like protein (cupin superfamily)
MAYGRHILTYRIMPKLIDTPAVIEAAGNKPKRIEELVGRVNTNTTEISVAKMTSPQGWTEPGQAPEFREITYVISGELHVEHKEGLLRVKSGQAVITEPHEWIRYSTPNEEGAEYIAICLPAFSPETVHRDL